MSPADMWFWLRTKLWGGEVLKDCTLDRNINASMVLIVGTVATNGYWIRADVLRISKRGTIVPGTKVTAPNEGDRIYERESDDWLTPGDFS